MTRRIIDHDLADIERRVFEHLTGRLGPVVTGRVEEHPLMEHVIIEEAVEDPDYLHLVKTIPPSGVETWMNVVAVIEEAVLLGAPSGDFSTAVHFLCGHGWRFDMSDERIKADPFVFHHPAFSVNRLQDVAALRRLGRPCFPKEQHVSKGAAEAQMRSIIRRDLEKDVELIHVYECTCIHPETGKRAWHVGHGRGGNA